jgi:hypothetical protein
MHTSGSLFVRLPTRIYGLTKGEGIDGDRYWGERSWIGWEIQTVTREIIIKSLFLDTCSNVRQEKETARSFNGKERGSRDNGLDKVLISGPQFP